MTFCQFWNETHARRQKGMAQVLHSDIHSMAPPSSCWVGRCNFFNIKVEEHIKVNEKRRMKAYKVRAGP